MTTGTELQQATPEQAAPQPATLDAIADTLISGEEPVKKPAAPTPQTREEQTQATVETTPQKAEPTPDGTGDASEDDPFDFLDALPATDDADNDAADEPDGDADDDTVDEDPVFRVKVDGEEREVKLSELTKSYSGQGAIDKRLQEASEMRKTAQAEIEQQLAQTRDLTERLQTVYQQFNHQLVVPRVAQPDPNLYEVDPVGYLKQAEDFRADQMRMAQERQEIEGALQQASETYQQQLGAKLQGEVEKLETALPALKDPVKKGKFKAAVDKTITRFGFTQEEVNGVMDHRLLIMAAENAAYHDLLDRMKDGKAPAPTVRRRQPMPARGQAPRTNSGRKASKTRQVMAKAQETGSVDDVAATLLI